MPDYHECPVCGRLDSNQNALIQDHRSGKDGHFPCPGSGQLPKVSDTSTGKIKMPDPIPVNLAPLIAWLEKSRSNEASFALHKDQFSIAITLETDCQFIGRTVNADNQGSIESALKSMLSDLA